MLEKEILKKFIKKIKLNSSTIIGPGDDSAYLSFPTGEIIISTDTFVENIHFKKEWSLPNQIVEKSLKLSISDILAMGITPTSFLLTIGFPYENENELVELLNIFNNEGNKIGMDLIGGDLVKSSIFFISITVLGNKREGDKVRKLRGLKEGFVLAVSGELGSSMAGLKLLDNNLHISDYLIECYKNPQINFSALEELKALDNVLLTDITDGLVSELYMMIGEDNLDIKLKKNLPKNERLNLVKNHFPDIESFVLNGGEDTVFLCAVPFEKKMFLTNWTIIGNVKISQKNQPGRVLDYNGKYIENRGWDSFKIKKKLNE